MHEPDPLLAGVLGAAYVRGVQSKGVGVSLKHFAMNNSENFRFMDNTLKGALFLRRILESNSLRSMSMSAGKSFPWNFAEGFVNLANGHLLKGVQCFLSPVKVPALPKEKQTERNFIRRL